MGQCSQPGTEYMYIDKSEIVDKIQCQGLRTTLPSNKNVRTLLMRKTSKCLCFCVLGGFFHDIINKLHLSKR